MRRGDTVILAAAALVGPAIVWVDARPNWNDTGITVEALLLTSAISGTPAPRRPWMSRAKRYYNPEKVAVVQPQDLAVTK